MTRDIAGCFRFWILIQCGERPARYGRSLCFDTKPTRPSRQAWRNRSGPISPCSKSLRKMPSTRWTRNRERFAFRIVSGNLRMSSPSLTRQSKA